jgi:hypothetical protein
MKSNEGLGSKYACASTMALLFAKGLLGARQLESSQDSN